MRTTDHCFVTSAPVFALDADDFTDPFFNQAEPGGPVSPETKACVSSPFAQAPAKEIR